MKISFTLFVVTLFTSSGLWGQRIGESRDQGSGGGSSVNYVIQPYDLLLFRVFQEPDMDSEVRVEADGSVRLPLIGDVSLFGRTLLDAQELLFKLYDADYLVNPQINLRVLEFAERKVNVLGQVNGPGFVLIPPDRPLFLTDAVAGAGGPTRLANMKKIQLKRTLNNGEVISRELNMERILSDPQSRDFPLEDGDTVFVPERVF